MHRHRRFAPLLAIMVVASCLAPPDLPPRKMDAGAAAPELLPISNLLAQRADGPHAVRLLAAPDARAASLRARAASLRGPVIPPEERRRLLASRARLR